LSLPNHEYFEAPRAPAAGAELQAWLEQAAHWIARSDRTRAMTAPATRSLLESLDVHPGDRVLDVAAGSGDPALAIAALVGPSGSVTATDGVPDMVAALVEAARAAGLSNVNAKLSSAETLDVAPASHDAACCRFGVMFFADPLAALRAMHRAVRPGGRLAVMAWGAPAANPYFTLAMESLDAAGAPPLPTPPGAKTVFEFGEPGRLAALARSAGWQSVTEESVRFTLDLVDTTPDTALDVLASLSTKVGKRVEGLDRAVRERARALLAEHVSPFVRGPVVAFPAQALLVAGRA